MNAQEIFDKVKNALKEQGGPSTSPDGSCLYHGPNDLKCGAGHLLLEGKWHKEMEGGGVYDMHDHQVDYYFGISADYQELIVDLQGAHDNANTCWTDWEGRMEKVARKHGLEA